MAEPSLDRELRALLVCPVCRGELTDRDDALRCPACRLDYPLHGDVPVMLPERAAKVTDAG